MSLARPVASALAVIFVGTGCSSTPSSGTAAPSTSAVPPVSSAAPASVAATSAAATSTGFLPLVTHGASPNAQFLVAQGLRPSDPCFWWTRATADAAYFLVKYLTPQYESKYGAETEGFIHTSLNNICLANPDETIAQALAQAGT